MATAHAMPPPSIEASAQPDFAPRMNTVYRYRIEQVRDEAGTQRRYATDRTVVFSRDAVGLVADLTIISVDGGLANGPGVLFERAFAGLIGRRIRYRLSPSGDVTDVEDRDTVWNHLVDGILTQAGANAERAAMAQRLSAPFRAMPPAQRIAFLGSMLASVLAPDVVRGGVRPATPIRQTGKPPFGIGTIVTGTERVWMRPHGTLVQERTVTGDIGSGQVAGKRTTTLTREVDRDTGMVHRQVEITRTRTGAATSQSTTHITIR